ncbi:MAG: NIPSNAP family protein [Acidobacteriota bacterium]|nr:NIPSNAP family protein [Acidobacteriota bacterium]
MNIKLLTAVTVMLFLIGAAPAQTKRKETTSLSDSAMQKNQSQKNRLPNSKNRVFEVRTYTIAQKWDVYMPFFTGTTMELFKKHGFETVGFWIPQDAPDSENTLVYILAFPDRETANKKWEAFFNDPKWKQDRAAFIAKYGKITDKIVSQFVSPVDFSPIK